MISETEDRQQAKEREKTWLSIYRGYIADGLRRVERQKKKSVTDDDMREAGRQVLFNEMEEYLTSMMDNIDDLIALLEED